MYEFDLDKIKMQYKQSKGWGRELGKWAFALGTLGFGGLYLWGN